MDSINGPLIISHSTLDTFFLLLVLKKQSPHTNFEEMLSVNTSASAISTANHNDNNRESGSQHHEIHSPVEARADGRHILAAWDTSLNSARELEWIFNTLLHDGDRLTILTVLARPAPDISIEFYGMCFEAELSLLGSGDGWVEIVAYCRAKQKLNKERKADSNSSTQLVASIWRRKNGK